MNLAQMLFKNLQDEDYYGLKILKNGFNASNENNSIDREVSSHYLEDVIVLETKRMNSSVKSKYLAEFTGTLQAHKKSND